ncbi:RNA-binding protein 20-like isoform X2 [Arapaima gigas]
MNLVRCRLRGFCEFGGTRLAFVRETVRSPPNMSHNYLPRGAPEDFKPHPGSSRSADDLHAGQEHDIYKPSREMSASLLPSFAASNSSLESYTSQGSSTENALSLLASCGLDPEDLSLLAGMPDNLITMETLPRLLVEIKEKKAGKDRPSGCASPTSHSNNLPPSGAWRDGTNFHSEGHLTCQPSQKAPDNWNEDWQDHWGNPQPSSSISQESSLSTSSYVVDYNYGHVREQGTRSYQNSGHNERAKYNRARSAEYHAGDPRDRVGNSHERSDEYQWDNNRGRVGNSREQSDEYRWDDDRGRVGNTREGSDEYRWDDNRGRVGNTREGSDEYRWDDNRGRVGNTREGSDEYRWDDNRGRVGNSHEQLDGYPGVGRRAVDYHGVDSRGRVESYHDPLNEYCWGDNRVRGRNSRERSDEYRCGDNRGRMGSSREHWPEYQGVSRGTRSEGGRNPSSDRWSSERAGSHREFSAGYRGVNRGRNPPLVTSKKSAVRSKHPSKQESDDFHGVMPYVFPYACSLCDIVVLSQRDWTSHINGSQHADSQLSVLQMYPDWDCRSDSTTGGRCLPESKRQAEKPASTQSRGNNFCCFPRSRVISLKFAPDSVNKAYLMDLVKPFGIPLNFAVFPTKAFLEMGSHSQAEDIVKFYRQNPVIAKESEVLFSLSTSFTFPQTSQVICFSRLPPGEEKNTELIAIAKRFGQVKHSLFLPNRVFVEMAEPEHAQKLVDYYGSHPLKMKGKHVLVSYSTEYTTLKGESPDGESRTSSYSSQSYSTRSSSPRSKSTETEPAKNQTNGEKTVGEKPQVGDNTQPQPKEQAVEESSTEINTELKGTNKEDSNTLTEESISDPMGTSEEAAIVGQSIASQAGHEERKSGPLDSDSDIEGMEVIGEDEEDKIPSEDPVGTEVCGQPEEPRERGESTEMLQGGPAEVLVEEFSLENDCVVEQACVKHTSQVTPEDQRLPKPDMDQPEEMEMPSVKEEQADEPAALEEEEPDFPESLEHCITLDEVLDEDEDGNGNVVKDEDRADSAQCLSSHQEHGSGGRVLYVRNLPKAYYTDLEFVRIVKGLGKVRRYFLIRSRQEGFIEMERAEDAERAAKELMLRPPEIHWSFLLVHLSRKYQRLTCGWVPEPDPSEERVRRKDRRGTSRSEEKEGSRSRSRSRSRSTQEEPPTKMARLQDEKAEKQGEGDAETPPSHKESQLKSDVTKTSQTCDATETQSDTTGESGTEGSVTVCGDKTGEQDQTQLDQSLCPVGQEFVQPVVGYLCSLCDTIFTSEDEAKNKHCGSLTHHEKFQARLDADRKPEDSGAPEQKAA